MDERTSQKKLRNEVVKKKPSLSVSLCLCLCVSVSLVSVSLSLCLSSQLCPNFVTSTQSSLFALCLGANKTQEDMQEHADSDDDLDLCSLFLSERYVERVWSFGDTEQRLLCSSMSSVSCHLWTFGTWKFNIYIFSLGSQ